MSYCTIVLVGTFNQKGSRMELLAIGLTLIAVLGMTATSLYRKHLLNQGYAEQELLVT